MGQFLSCVTAPRFLYVSNDVNVLGLAQIHGFTLFVFCRFIVFVILAVDLKGSLLFCFYILKKIILKHYNRRASDLSY